LFYASDVFTPVCDRFVVSPKDPLIKGQRCVILADGFYEWKRQAREKQPFFIYFPQTEGTGREKRDDDEEEDDPATSADNKENSETTCPPEEASADLTEVNIRVYAAI